MEQQSLRNCWLKGKGAINAWCSIPNAVTAEMMSMNDFDSITIDMQHGLVLSNCLKYASSDFWIWKDTYGKSSLE